MVPNLKRLFFLITLVIWPMEIYAQRAPVYMNPNTGALTEPVAATFRSANTIQTLDATLTALSGKSTTGSGDIVLSTSPVFTTPNVGVATATSVNGVALSGSSSPALTVTGTTSISGANTGDQTNITGNAATSTALQNPRTISVTGDLTYTSPAFDGTGNVTAAGTLATVNSNVGSFGSSTSIPSFTVNAKGLVTAASGNVVIAPAGTLTGSTLASGVTASALTSAAGGAFGTAAYVSTGASGGTVPLLNASASISGQWAVEGAGSLLVRPTTNALTIGSDVGASTISNSTAKAAIILGYRYSSTNTARIFAWDAPSANAGTLYLGGHVGAGSRSAQSVIIATDPSESSTASTAARVTVSDAAVTIAPPLVASGTLAVTGATTLTGNLTGNGTANTLPNQTAAGGSYVMTRDLVDARGGYTKSALVQSNQVVTDSNTMTDSTALQLTLEVGTWYVDTFELIGSSAYATGGAKSQLTFTGTTTYVGTRFRSGASNIEPINVAPTWGGSGENMNGACNFPTQSSLCVRRGYVIVTVQGTLKVQFAQSAETGASESATLLVGSYIRATKQ